MRPALRGEHSCLTPLWCGVVCAPAWGLAAPSLQASSRQGIDPFGLVVWRAHIGSAKHEGSVVEPPHDEAVYSRACFCMHLCFHRRSAPRRSAHTAAGCGEDFLQVVQELLVIFLLLGMCMFFACCVGPVRPDPEGGGWPKAGGAGVHGQDAAEPESTGQEVRRGGGAGAALCQFASGFVGCRAEPMHANHLNQQRWALLRQTGSAGCCLEILQLCLSKSITTVLVGGGVCMVCPAASCICGTGRRSLCAPSSSGRWTRRAACWRR